VMIAASVAPLLSCDKPGATVAAITERSAPSRKQ
jgi:hypothetical protein